MIKPTITLSGTTPRELQEELMKVRTALIAALDAIHRYPLHARDYPNEQIFYAAVKEWRERERQIRVISEETLELAIHCQGEANNRRPPLNWAAAEAHLEKAIEAQTQMVAPSDLANCMALKRRLIDGERTVDLYEAIMEVKP